jgi:hypothetical protein
MGVSPNSILIHRFQLQDLASYLQLIGWELHEPPAGRWLVFVGASDINGEPLEIVLPREPNVPDVNVYLANAVDILSVVAQEPSEVTTRRIRFHNRDVLNVRNIETGEQDSIALRLASKQVSELKNLVAYSACSEHDPRPHFDTLLGIGRRMIERYRFGHTFPGSFGFTIESPPIGKPTIYTRSPQGAPVPEQIPLIPEEELPRIPPFGRRVMERIVRGLNATQQATRERDVSVLVNSYPSGFNSRMCAAVVQMAKGKVLPLEYTVLWSPKIAPGDDIADPGTIRLNEASYLYLLIRT